MKQQFKNYASKITDRFAARVAEQLAARTAGRHAAAPEEVAYLAASETIMRGARGGEPRDLFSGVSDGFWFWLLTEGVRRNSEIRDALPAIPDEEVQVSFTGASGDVVLKEGFQFYELCKELYGQHAGALADCGTILDFGCGWGRIIRFFLKDVKGARLWGVDPVGEMIELCRRTNRWCSFERIETHPPITYAENSFDLIYSFSVFSHLSEEVQAEWVRELARTLKPGGLLIATTRNRNFINYCASLRKRADLASMHPSIRGSAVAFPDLEQSLADFDAGRYCFSRFAHTGWDYWGEAAISKAYALKHWTERLTFLDFIEERLSQNVIVMRKD